MYIFVMVQMKEKYYGDGAGGSKQKSRLEEASGERCLVVPYREMSMKVVRELSPRAIAVSGFGGHFQDHKAEWFYGLDEVFHEADVPMIGFCGGHQLMGFCFNRNIRKLKLIYDQPMRLLRPNEHWPRVTGGTGRRYNLSKHFVAVGVFPVRRVRPDPLFDGLPQVMLMQCWHYCEVKRLPLGFVRLAESDHCRIEAMRHRTLPIYGTQFHPEAYAEPFLHGRKVLRNFARIVDEFWKKRKER